MKLAGYLFMEWKDEFHIWEHIETLNCVPFLVVPHGPESGMWIPMVAITNSDSFFEATRPPEQYLRIFSDGSTSFSPSGLLEFHCEFNLSLFPFDEHKCNINIESFRYDWTQQLIKPGLLTFDRFLEHDQWHLQLDNLRPINYTYSTSQSTFSLLSISIRIHRKATYYVIVIVVPFVTISFVATVTFALPLLSNERLQLSFTCLLAFSFFQSVIISDLPHSSVHPPILLIFVTIMTATIALVIILQGLIIFLAEKSEQAKQKAGEDLNFTIFNFELGQIESEKWERLAITINRFGLFGFLAILSIASLVSFVILPNTIKQI